MKLGDVETAGWYGTRSKKMGRKMKPNSRAYKKEAEELARAWSPEIYPCVHCGHPVLEGYVCPHCNSANPFDKPITEKPLEATMIELRDLSDDDPAFLPDLIHEFFARSVPLLAQMQQAMDQGDYLELTKAAHTLKGSAKNIGAMRLGERCSELEKMGRQESGEGIPDQVEYVRMEFSQAEEALQGEIAAWPSPHQ